MNTCARIIPLCETFCSSDRTEYPIKIVTSSSHATICVPATYLVSVANSCLCTTPFSLAVMWVRAALLANTLVWATVITALTLGTNPSSNAIAQVLDNGRRIRVPDPYDFSADTVWFTASDYHEPYIRQSTAMASVSFGAMEIWRKVRACMHCTIFLSERRLTRQRILNWDYVTETHHNGRNGRLAYCSV